MSDKKNKKTIILIATAIGTIMGIYANTLNQIKKDLMPDKPDENFEKKDRLS